VPTATRAQHRIDELVLTMTVRPLSIAPAEANRLFARCRARIENGTATMHDPAGAGTRMIQDSHLHGATVHTRVDTEKWAMLGRWAQILRRNDVRAS